MVLEELLTHWPLKRIRAILPRMLISHTGGTKMDIDACLPEVFSDTHISVFSSLSLIQD